MDVTGGLEIQTQLTLADLSAIDARYQRRFWPFRYWFDVAFPVLLSWAVVVRSALAGTPENVVYDVIVCAGLCGWVLVVVPRRATARWTRSLGLSRPLPIRIEASDDALRLTGSDVRREIPWTTIDGVERLAGRVFIEGSPFGPVVVPRSSIPGKAITDYARSVREVWKQGRARAVGSQPAPPPGAVISSLDLAEASGEWQALMVNRWKSRGGAVWVGTAFGAVLCSYFAWPWWQSSPALLIGPTFAILPAVGLIDHLLLGTRARRVIEQQTNQGQISAVWIEDEWFACQEGDETCRFGWAAVGDVEASSALATVFVPPMCRVSFGADGFEDRQQFEEFVAELERRRDQAKAA